MSTWLPYFDLFCAIGAGGMWYLRPELGPWPLLLGCLPWLERLFTNGRLTRRTPYDLPLLLFLLTAGLSVWAAYDRPAAFAKFWVIVGGVLIFYAVANYREKGSEPFWLLAFFGAGVTLYFLATNDWATYPGKLAIVTRIGQAIQGMIPAVPGHRLHPNVVGGILATTIPCGGAAIWQAVHQRQRGITFFLAVVWAVTLFGLFMTTSRGAWLAVAAALAAAGLWWLFGQFGSAQHSHWLFNGLLVLAGLGTITLFVTRPELLRLFGDSNRPELMRNSLILIQEYPLIGAGLDGYLMLYSTYSFLIHVGFSVHAHNLFINVAIEQGLPGLLALLWLAWLIGYGWWQETGRGGSVRPGIAVAGLTLLILCVHGLVDDPLYGSRAVLLLFMPMAFAVPSAPSPSPTTRPARQQALGWALAATGLMMLLLFGGRSLAATWFANLAAIEQSRIELGVYAWPEWPVQDEVRRQFDLTQPITLYQRALSLAPANAAANRRLGQIELSLAQYDQALMHLEQAYMATPWDNATRQLYGEALIVTGRVNEGAAQWSTVNNSEQQLILRAFWYEHIGDTARLQAIRPIATSIRN